MTYPNPRNKKSVHPFWDLFCFFSILGIWPRFIEPKLLCSTRKILKIPNLDPSLKGFKILQFTDLHIHEGTPQSHLDKLTARINDLQPDLITYTGDFICYGQLNTPERLKSFLNSLQAPYGCYAVAGNHDFKGYISVNHNGDYDITSAPQSSINRGFARLAKTTQLTTHITPKARAAIVNPDLTALLKQTPFKLLFNETNLIHVGKTKLNICGLGEHMMGGVNPSQAYQGYDSRYPGIILLHNPDGIDPIKHYPGDIVLCGHTHGAQINLPWLWNKFCVLEKPQYKRGMHRIDGKWLYVNRGVGGIIPIRLFSPPEILLLTLEAQ